MPTEITSSENEVFYVERILGKKIVAGRAVYKIKWLGYDNPEDDTWEDENNLYCDDLLDDWNQREKKEEEKEEKRKKNISYQIYNSLPVINSDKFFVPKSRYRVELSKPEESKPHHQFLPKPNLVGNAQTETPKTIKKPESEISTTPKSECCATFHNEDSAAYSGEREIQGSPSSSAVENKVSAESEGIRVSGVLALQKDDRAPGGIVALVKYADGEFEMVPTSVLMDYAPKMLVRFYEERIYREDD